MLASNVLERAEVRPAAPPPFPAPVPAAPTGPLGLGWVNRLPRWMLFGQLGGIVVLGSLHAAITWAPTGTYHPLIVRLVDMDNEANLPTWFASMQWLFLALTLAAIAVVSHVTGRGRLKLVLWTLCTGVALYLSLDEVAILHERFGTILEEVVQSAPAGSVLRSLVDFHSYYWIFVYLPFAIPIVVGGAVFFWKELGPARWPALLGMFTFIYAAVGLDAIEGYFGSDAHTGIALTIASRRFDFDILLMEEALEMLGVALALYACSRHLAVLVSRARPAGVRRFPTAEPTMSIEDDRGETNGPGSDRMPVIGWLDPRGSD